MSLTALLGYEFRDPELLVEACTHCSYVNEHRGEGMIPNERLEFLGDSILGFLISQWLYKRFPGASEGELTRWRAQLVEAPACAAYAEALGLEPFLRLGRGEQRNIGKGRASVLADFFEALVGALYLDGGIEAAEHFVLVRHRSLLEGRLQRPDQNYKAALQDRLQQRGKEPPTYTLLGEEGPAHQRCFVVEVHHNGQPLATGRGSSKKEAQQEAARCALRQLSET